MQEKEGKRESLKAHIGRKKAEDINKMKIDLGVVYNTQVRENQSLKAKLSHALIKKIICNYLFRETKPWFCENGTLHFDIRF